MYFECRECDLKGTKQCKACQEDQEELDFEQFLIWEDPEEEYMSMFNDPE